MRSLKDFSLNFDQLWSSQNANNLFLLVKKNESNFFIQEVSLNCNKTSISVLQGNFF